MKALVIFYSRSGKTKKVAKKISALLKCDMEEIIDTRNRKGIPGFLSAGSDANMRRLTTLKDIKKDPSLYDLLIIGTPVWSSNISTPIRTYITLHKRELKNIAFFCTRLGSNAEKVFADMENICQKKPFALLELTSREVVRNMDNQKIDDFIKKIKEQG